MTVNRFAGLAIRKITVKHVIKLEDGYFGENKIEDREVDCLIQVLSSLDVSDIGVAGSSALRLKLHVSKPVDRNVEVGDTFTYEGNDYKVTGVDDGIMKENIVPMVPFRWTFTGEAINGTD